MATWDPDNPWVLVASCSSPWGGEGWEVWYNKETEMMWDGRTTDNFEHRTLRYVDAFVSQDWADWFEDTVSDAVRNVRRIQGGEALKHKEKPWYLKTGEADLKYERSE